ncbi:MAG: hypothetical protein K2Q09_05025, partial [Phycisphaerales bacterium]|nr:hypothetical protein [Phycisphaerales bacterium]
MLLPLVQAFAIVALTADARPQALVVADLGSPDFCVREAASDELARAGDVYRLADLEKALEDPALTAEQRLRLDGAAFRAFADSPRAALGV